MKKTTFLLVFVFMVAFGLTLGPALAAKKPNILVIWGDDIGITNISAYSHGMMGYKTPNIDRIAKEGALFTDYYAEQSCTAGRASFITGQIPFRVGLSKVGMPGAKQGISDKDPTLAELLKPHGYATAQFGKNHLGDRNEYLPTVHGFDEYAGLLYHLNAFEEPENVDYPKDPAFFAKYGPRDAIHSWATDKHDPTEDPRFGVVGKQRIESMGQVNKKRMETYDDETIAQTLDFMQRTVKDDKPFFIWHNTSRAHKAFVCHHVVILRAQVGKGMRAARVVPDEEGFVVLDGPLHEIKGLSDRLVVIGFHALLGHLAHALDFLFAHHPEARVFRLVEFVCRPGMNCIARSIFREEGGILGVIDIFRLFEGVQVIEQAGVLIESVHRGQILVSVTKVILAELPGSVAIGFQ